MAASPFATLLAAAQAGEAWAFGEIYRELAPAVSGYLAVQGAAEPDDLTSEVFVGVFRAIGTFTGPPAAFRSWVFTIAHRRLIDERRRAARRPANVEITDEREPPGGDVEDDAIVRLTTARIRELCGRLRADHRDVLLLRLVGGLTVEQVAGVIGKSVGATKALQRRGLAALRREIEREGVPL